MEDTKEAETKRDDGETDIPYRKELDALRDAHTSLMRALAEHFGTDAHGRLMRAAVLHSVHYILFAVEEDTLAQT